MHPFAAPDGVVTVQIDPTTGALASPHCPATQAEVFIAGVEPTEICPVHGGGAATLAASWDDTPQPPDAKNEPAPGKHAVASNPHKPATPSQPTPAPAAKPEKKGFLHRMLDVFK